VCKLSTRGDSHDKNIINPQKNRKQHTPEFRNEALKLAEQIGVTLTQNPAPFRNRIPA